MRMMQLGLTGARGEGLHTDGGARCTRHTATHSGAVSGSEAATLPRCSAACVVHGCMGGPGGAARRVVGNLADKARGRSRCIPLAFVPAAGCGLASPKVQCRMIRGWLPWAPAATGSGACAPRRTRTGPAKGEIPGVVRPCALPPATCVRPDGPRVLLYACESEWKRRWPFPIGPRAAAAVWEGITAAQGLNGHSDGGTKKLYMHRVMHE